ncbi:MULTISPECIES: hypothetical protein [unclassified Actinomyces]|nr:MULTISPECIES: hypothetical protein [unclassified Actinomyces]MBW3068005.1 hypothetical protein [Actinomyces sp. 594]NDR53534.1 hypothetical protein [Actinomyces sp. 565]
MKAADEPTHLTRDNDLPLHSGKGDHAPRVLPDQTFIHHAGDSPAI